MLQWTTLRPGRMIPLVVDEAATVQMTVIGQQPSRPQITTPVNGRDSQASTLDSTYRPDTPTDLLLMTSNERMNTEIQRATEMADMVSAFYGAELAVKDEPEKEAPIIKRHLAEMD